jgi:hypothetical protein
MLATGTVSRSIEPTAFGECWLGRAIDLLPGDCRPARALRVRRQVAHRLAHEAVQAGVIDLVPNPQDKRLLQAVVTPKGRAELAAARIAEQVWLTTLLNGLGDVEMKATTRVVRVIRQRLEARELER